MKNNLATLFLRLFGLLLLSSGAATAADQVTWKKSNGDSGEWAASTVEFTDRDRRLIFIAAKFSEFKLKSAKLKDGDSWVPIVIRSQGEFRYILLPDSSGELQLDSELGETSVYQFQYQSTSAALKISPTCQSLQLKLKINLPAFPTAPALLSCTSRGNEVQDVVFSSVGNSTWYGADIFEVAGKGERWKVFSAKDILALTDAVWKISWGDEAKRNTAEIRFTRPKGKAPEDTPSSFLLSVGAEYLSGTIERSTTSSPISGLVIPFRVQIRLKPDWWYVGGGFDFFAYSTKKLENSSNASSILDIWTGAESRLGVWDLRGDLGYLNRNIDAPGVNVSSSFEALRFRAEVAYRIGPQKVIGFFGQQATTSQQGRFSEMDLGLYYQDQFFWQKNFRLQLKSTSIEASGKTLDLKSQWISFGAGFHF